MHRLKKGGEDFLARARRFWGGGMVLIVWIDRRLCSRQLRRKGDRATSPPSDLSGMADQYRAASVAASVGIV
jgi:hypothetical protein